MGRSRGPQGSQRSGGSRSLLRQSRYITSAALEEAAADGAHELEVEHLLLGLLVTGGPSAALLTGAGVDLDSLRRAVRDVRHSELAALGMSLPVPEATRRPEPSFRAAQTIPFNSRAMALMRGLSYTGDDRELLSALLEEEGRRVERVLLATGVDVERLRDVARTGGGDLPERAEPGELLDADTVTTLVQELPVNAERVWLLVSDPSRRPEWDTACVRAEADGHGVELLTYRTRGRDVVVQQVVERLVPGGEIRWHRFRAGTRSTSSTLGLRLEPSGRSCRLHLEVRSAPAQGRSLAHRLARRALRPLTRRLAGSQVRWYAQAIARAAARTGGGG